MKKPFASHLLFQGSIEQDYLSKDKKVSVFVMFNKNINFSTEFQYRDSLKKQEFITWYSLLDFILLKMTISSALKWEISTAEVTLL